jgi:hypothetical protein
MEVEANLPPPRLPRERNAGKNGAILQGKLCGLRHYLNQILI